MRWHGCEDDTVGCVRTWARHTIYRVGAERDQPIVDDASGYRENNKCDTIRTSKYLNDPIYTLLDLPRSQLGRNISLIHFFRG